ncbi:MAG: 4a-hydroxytetrahydrobiopterin dehydratase [Actinobacteria bacterium]|nr:4a-hydroxytetrahydrobiopterin dehydratase [Actinomycetota bacterium]
MDMLSGDAIAGAGLREWRKLAQGLHARYAVPDFAGGARFVAAIGSVGDAHGHYPRVSMGPGYVDLKLSTADAIYRDDDGVEHIVEWVTQRDVDTAAAITACAGDLGLTAEPDAVSVIELGLDTADSSQIAPFWAALLTGDADARGRGTPGDEIRDATGRSPNLWFGDAPEASGQRFHLEVYVPRSVAAARLADALAAGGTIVDDSESPGLTVLADSQGNLAVLCVAEPALPED